MALSDSTAALLPPAHAPARAARRARLLRLRPAAGCERRRPAARSPVDEAGARAVPAQRLRAQVLAEQGEAEHRSVAVAFVRFSGTDDAGPHRRARRPSPRRSTSACATCSAATDEHDVTFFETDIDRDGGKVMLVAGAPRSSGRDEERMLRAVRAVMDRAGVLPAEDRGQPRQRLRR